MWTTGAGLKTTRKWSETSSETHTFGNWTLFQSTSRNLNLPLINFTLYLSVFFKS
jgi:hypothetical protein